MWSANRAPDRRRADAHPHWMPSLDSTTVPIPFPTFHRARRPKYVAYLSAHALTPPTSFINTFNCAGATLLRATYRNARAHLLGAGPKLGLVSRLSDKKQRRKRPMPQTSRVTSTMMRQTLSWFRPRQADNAPSLSIFLAKCGLTSNDVCSLSVLTARIRRLTGLDGNNSHYPTCGP